MASPKPARQHSVNSSRDVDSWLIKGTLLLVSTLTVMAGATIAPSLPTMQQYFSEVPNVAFWVRLVLTMPALFIVIGSPIAGQLTDRVGRKSLLVGAALLYGLAGASGFWLNALFAILVGRALLGLAVAGVMVSATTLIADYYQGDDRANFMGLQAAFMGLGGVAFLSVGGFIADLSWRLPFLIYLFAWVLLPALLLILFEPARPAFEAQTAASVEVARLPLKLLIFVYGAALVAQVAFYLIPVQLPFYLQQISQANATQSGLAIALSTFMSAIASKSYGGLKRRFSYINILAIAFLLMGVGYIGIGLANSYGLVLLVLVPTGLGLGLLLPNLNVWTAAEVPNELRGRALGGLTTFFFLGQFLSPVVSQPVSTAVGLAPTYGFAGALLATGGALLWVYKKTICQAISTRVGQL